MTVRRIDIGYVSADGSLVNFLAEVFDLDQIESSEFPPGTVHRLQAPGGVVKVMVPRVTPKPPEPSETVHETAGLRYLTIRVDDLDGVIERAVVRGARVVMGPVEILNGVRVAMLHDADGNIIEVAQDPA